ncbi:MAG: DNA polymerase III subunit delta [Pseudomonadota bacterium]
MPDIAYQNLKQYLEELRKGALFPVYLMYGEEYLYRSVFKQIVDILLPGSDKSFNFEEIEGSEDNVSSLAEALKTFSFLSKRKVIAYTDAKIFYSKTDEEKLLEKAKAAYDKNEMKKAVKHMASYLGVMGLTFDELSENNRNPKIQEVVRNGMDTAFFNDIFQYASENSLAVPPDRDYAKMLQDTIENGFPKGNILIITTDQIDKRKTLFKSIKKTGMIIDCSVPKGSRMADRKIQETMMKEVMEQILSESGKKIDPAAYRGVLENTGFDFNIFAGSLKKLIDFSGTEPRITVEHVAAVLNRTREDPIYELTGAVSDRNTELALFFLASLLSAGIFPLQILSAVINQMRKLLILKDFTQSAYGKNWNKNISFDQFRNTVMRGITAYDQEMQNVPEAEEEDAAIPQKKGGRKKKVHTDLLIAKNPNNPYPVFQSLLKVENFTGEEMIQALETLSIADMRLKTTALNHKIVLEEMIIRICRKG